MLKLKKWKQVVITITTFMFVLELIAIANILLDKPLDPGSITDWFSTIADLLMAGAAIYAAWNAKDWLRTKVKENALMKVTDFLNDCDSFSSKMETEINKIHYLLDTTPDYQPDNFSSIVREQLVNILKIRGSLKLLKNQYKSLALWNVSPSNNSTFEDYFKYNFRALSTFEEALSFDDDNYAERLSYSKKYHRTLHQISDKLKDQRDNLRVSINELFEF